jgi:N-acetylneuraminate synthase
LNVLDDLRRRYGCPVGLSDHSGTIYASLAAVALGANLIEVHVTLSRNMFGPDVPASIAVEELRELADGIRFIDRALSNPVDKDALAEELGPLRRVFTKSVVLRDDLPAGTVLEREHLAAKKPGTGIPASKLPALVGRRLLRDVTADELLDESDVE